MRPSVAARGCLRTGAISVRSMASESDFSLQEQLDAHNEVIEEVMRDAAADFAERAATVEVALEAPAKWWDEVVGPRLDRIAAAAGLSPGDVVLDVGVGTGTMIGFLTKDGRAREADVVGVDLCEEMLDIASERYPEATLVVGDVLTATLADLQLDKDAGEDAEGGGVGDAPAAMPRAFDAVVLNAVFSTLFDPKLALSAASGLAARGGRVVVSHPLGAPFVKQLRGAMPDLILHELPGKAALAKLVEFEALRVLGVEEEEELYIATLVRTPRRAPQP